MVFRTGLMLGAAFGAIAWPVAAQDRLAPGQPVAGMLSAADGRLSDGEFFDAYTFEGREGQTITLRLSSEEFDPYLMLRGPGGFAEDNDDAAEGDTSGLLNVRLPASGTYRVNVTSYDAAETGRYRLALDGGQAGATGPRPPATVSDRRLVPGRTAQGALGPGDDTLAGGEFNEIWTVSGRRGQTLEVSMTSAALDSYLIVRGPGGLSEENDDEAGRGGRDSRIRFTLESDGEVRIGATSFRGGEVGAYAITLAEVSADAPERAAAPTDGRLVLGQTIDGRLGAGDAQLADGEYLNRFAFTGRQGQQIDLRLASTEFDPYLQISGPDGFVVANDDDAGGGTDSRLIVTLPAAGDYTVLATSYGPQETGAYRLSALEGSSAAAPPPSRAASHGDGEIAIGDSVSGALAAGDETIPSGEFIDTYRFSGRRGQRVAVDLTSSAFDAYLIMAGPSGERIVNDDGIEGTDSRIETALTETGEYEVGVTSFAPGEAGSYRFSVMPSAGSARQAVVQGGPRVFAIMVGVSDYAGSANNLPFTDEDAEKLSETLRREGVLHPSSITLTNAEATVDGVKAAFAQVAAEAGPDDLFLFFFSGHGEQVDGAVSALEPDGRNESIVLRDGSISDVELGTMFSSLRTRLSMLVLDSCFSGGFARNVVDRPGVMGVFSSEEDLTSDVAGKFQAGGYLSHFVRAALAGEADRDADRAVTAGELAAHLRRRFASDVVDVEATTTDGQRNYQNLVIDRGGVQVDDIVIRLAPQSVALGGL